MSNQWCDWAITLPRSLTIFPYKQAMFLARKVSLAKCEPQEALTLPIMANGVELRVLIGTALVL